MYGQDHEDIFAEGQDAAFEGLGYEDNPYDDDRAGIWDAGFTAAFEAADEAAYDGVLAQQELEDFEGMEFEDHCGSYEDI